MPHPNKAFYKFTSRMYNGLTDEIHIDKTDEIIRFLLGGLDETEVAELRRYLEANLANMSDEELESDWAAGNADYYLEPVRPFLERCVEYIKQRQNLE